MPGNVPRLDVTAQFRNVQSLGNYRLHISDYESDIAVAADTLYTIYASRGEPHQIVVYALLNGVSTDSIILEEYSQNNYVVSFKGVANGRLQYDLSESPVAQSAGSEAGTAGDAPDTVVRFWKTNELLIGVSFVALLGLITYFLWRKKKKGPGNIDAAL